MFYDFLKSIYNIVENYKSNYSCFHDMIILNDYFINNLNTKNNHMSLNNYNLNYNQNQTQIGGDPIDQLRVLNKAIIDIINMMAEKISQGQQYDFTELNAKIIQFNNASKKLIQYIELLHKIAPTQPEMSKLTKQLETINNILNKY